MHTMTDIHNMSATRRYYASRLTNHQAPHQNWCQYHYHNGKQYVYRINLPNPLFDGVCYRRPTNYNECIADKVRQTLEYATNYQYEIMYPELQEDNFHIRVLKTHTPQQTVYQAQYRPINSSKWSCSKRLTFKGNHCLHQVELERVEEEQYWQDDEGIPDWYEFNEGDE